MKTNKIIDCLIDDIDKILEKKIKEISKTTNYKYFGLCEFVEKSVEGAPPKIYPVKNIKGEGRPAIIDDTLVYQTYHLTNGTFEIEENEELEEGFKLAFDCKIPMKMIGIGKRKFLEKEFSNEDFGLYFAKIFPKQVFTDNPDVCQAKISKISVFTDKDKILSQQFVGTPHENFILDFFVFEIKYRLSFSFYTDESDNIEQGQSVLCNL